MKTSRAKSIVAPYIAGNSPCEKSLAKILLEINDPRTTQIVMRTLNKYQDGLKHIVQIHKESPGFARTIVKMWREEFGRNTATLRESHDWSQDLYTHLLCCLSADYKRAMEKMSEY